MRPMVAKVVAAIAAGGMALVWSVAAHAQSKNEYDLNDVGHRGVGDGMNFFSLDKEIALGKNLAQQVEATSRLQNDPVVNEYINRVAQNLVRNSDAKVPFTVRLIESPDINAAALPGGFFFVNTGLILAADNESELAGAMAHEIAHVAARHGTRNLTKAELVNYATIPLVFVAGPVGMAGRAAGQFAVPMSFLKFDRNAEREADFLGLQYMYLTGYDPQSFVNFFEKIETEEKHQPGSVAKAFETHPPTPDRIEASEREIAKVLPPKQDYVVDTSEFELVKARLAMLEHEAATQDKLAGNGKPSLRRPEASPDGTTTGDDEGRPTLERRDDSDTSTPTTTAPSSGSATSGSGSTTSSSSSGGTPASSGGTTSGSASSGSTAAAPAGSTPANTGNGGASSGGTGGGAAPAAASGTGTTGASAGTNGGGGGGAKGSGGSAPSTPPIGNTGNGDTVVCCRWPD